MVQFCARGGAPPCGHYIEKLTGGKVSLTMVLMFAALIALYEVALAVARYVLIARDGKASLKWTREDYEQHAFEEE